MRRIAFLAVVAAALACATAASSALQPLRRGHHGELSASKLKAPPQIPAQHASGRIRVIVRLVMPPLAEAFTDGLAVGGSARRLDVNGSAASSLQAAPSRPTETNATAMRAAATCGRVMRAAAG